MPPLPRGVPGSVGPGASAVRTKASSYHSNAAAALMQLGRMGDSLKACRDALAEDSKLGKALLRTAHVHLMLGDAGRARKYYAEASASGAVKEAEAGLKSCINEEQQQARLRLLD
eukprot:772340-Prymnesium_polylepis.1